MSLGVNRDYKTRDRSARKLLARHFSRMTELIAQGMNREDASRLAFREIRSANAQKPNPTDASRGER
jgi:hypothetical protein